MRKLRKTHAALNLPTLTLEGGLFLPDQLEKAALGSSPVGQSEVDYGLPKGLKLKDEYSRAFQIACAQWKHFAAQLEKFFFERFEEITASVGNAVDMKGEPFTAESHLDALERIDLDFDMFGFPIYPMYVAHPVMAETFRSELARFRTESLLKDRAETLIDRKRKEWRDREGRRRLVT